MKKKSVLILLPLLIVIALVSVSICIAQLPPLPPGFRLDPWGQPPETGYTPQQEAAMEGLKIGFHMGQTYAMAQQGYNINDFNAEVDNYNMWIQQNFGNNPNLIMQKMQAGVPSYVPESMPGYVPRTAPVIVFRDPLGWV